MTVSWTVKNIGHADTGVGNWSDKVYLSTDDVLSSDDQFLGSFAHAGILAADASYQQSQSIRLPDGISGNYRILVQVDAGNAVNEFVLEGNNVTASATATQVTLAPYTDLKPEDLSIAGPNPDGTFTFAWNTANRGNLAATGGWKEHVVVTNLTTGAVALTTDLDVTDPLAVDATLAHTLAFSIGAAGRYQATITTDSQDRLFEFNTNGHADAEQNNTDLATYDATLDLQVANLRVDPATDLQSGAALTVLWDDTNSGNRPTAGPFTDRVVITNTTTGAVLITATVSYDPNASGNGPILPGQSRSRQFAFTLPDGPPGVGSIQFTVTTDSANSIAEYNTAGTAESNNSSSVTRDSVLGLTPDLQAVNVALDPAIGLQSGSSLIVHWDDTNTGTKATGSSWSDSIVIKNTTTGETLVTATVPYDATSGGAITPGQSRSRQYAFTLPDGSRGMGRISFTITVDSSNQVFENNAAGTGESNNVVTVSVDTTIAPYPDLQVANLRVDPPTTLLSGAGLVVSWEDWNTGDRATNGSWSDSVTLKNLTTGVVLATASIPYDPAASGNGPILPGQSRARQAAITLPPGTQSVGVIQFTVTADSGSTVFEWDAAGDAESNNTATITRDAVLDGPDLQISNLRNDPATGLQSGSALVVRWEDANSGGVATGGSWSDSVTIKNTATGEVLASASVPYDPASGGNGDIAPGQSRSRQYAFTLPDGSRGAGPIMITVTVDSGNKVFEFNASGDAETNNTASVTQTATIAPYPDLQVASLRIDPATVLQSGAKHQPALGGYQYGRPGHLRFLA